MKRSTKDPKKKQHVFNFGAPEPWACCSDAKYIADYSDYASFSDMVMGDDELIDILTEKYDPFEKP